MIPVEVPLKTEPKAEKLPYSDEAFARMQGADAKPAVTPTQVKSANAASANAASEKAVVPPKVPAPAQPKGSVQLANAGVPDKEFDGAKWIWPAQGDITSRFDGARSKGIAIAGKQGDPVLAANSGKVVYVGKAIQAYGQLVIIKHSNDYLSVYAHNSTILVSEGQRVSVGQKIAEMGERSAAQAALHFEIRKRGQPVDPVKFLPSRESNVETPHALGKFADSIFVFLPSVSDREIVFRDGVDGVTQCAIGTTNALGKGERGFPLCGF